MSEAQTVENTPESILKPQGGSIDRLAQIASKHLASIKAQESPATETPAAEVKDENKAPATGNGEDKSAPLAIEDKPTTPEVKAKEDNDLLEQKRKIIRRENQLRKRQEELKRFESERGAFEDYKKNAPLVKEYNDLKELAKKNPTLANEKLGLSYDAWTQHLISESSRPKSPEQIEIDRLRADQESMRKERDEEKQTLKERQTQSAIEAFNHETEEAIKKEVDKYELIVLNNQIPGVINLRANEAYNSKKMPTVDQVASYAEGRYEKEWLPNFADHSKKLRTYLVSKGWTPPESKEIKKPVVSQTRDEPRTLSTELTTGSSPKPAKRAKDRDERLAQIIREHKLG